MNTREEWLTRAAHAIIDRVLAPAGLDTNADTGEPLAEKLRISVGFPHTAGARRDGRAVGVCYSPVLSAGGMTEIFISPFVPDGAAALSVLAHELIHGALGMKAGHGPVFKQACERIGLDGPALATVPGPRLMHGLEVIGRVLGPFIHDQLNVTTSSHKQGTRLLKCVCVNQDCPSQPDGGYTVRITWKWASEGTPFCGICEERMAVYVPNAVSGPAGEPPTEEPSVRIIAPQGGGGKAGATAPAQSGGEDGGGEDGGEEHWDDEIEPDESGGEPQGPSGVTKPGPSVHPANLTCPCNSCRRARSDAGLEEQNE